MTSCARAWRKSGLVSRASKARAGGVRSDLVSRASAASDLRERNETRDPAQKAAKRNIFGRDPSCGPWVPGLAALARDTRAGASSVRSDLLSRPSRARARARAEREPGPSAKRSERNRSRSVVRPMGPGSRCARPGHEVRMAFRDVEQSALQYSLPSSALTAQSSQHSLPAQPSQHTALLVPAARSRVRVVNVQVSDRLSRRISSGTDAAAGVSPWPSRQRPVRPPDEGRAERRQAHSSLFGRACEARPPRV